MAAGALLEAMTASHLNVIRVGILVVVLAEAAFWTYAGVVWISEDVTDLRAIDRRRSLGALAYK
jgi:hypothetical protein